MIGHGSNNGIIFFMIFICISEAKSVKGYQVFCIKKNKKEEMFFCSSIIHIVNAIFKSI